MLTRWRGACKMRISSFSCSLPSLGAARWQSSSSAVLFIHSSCLMGIPLLPSFKEAACLPNDTRDKRKLLFSKLVVGWGARGQRRARTCVCVWVWTLWRVQVCASNHVLPLRFFFLYTMLHFIITFVHRTTPAQKDLLSHHKYHTRWGGRGGGWGVSSADGQSLSKTKITCWTFATETGFEGFNLLCCCCCRLPCRSHYALILC